MAMKLLDEKRGHKDGNFSDNEDELTRGAK